MLWKLKRKSDDKECGFSEKQIKFLSDYLDPIKIEVINIAKDKPGTEPKPEEVISMGKEDLEKELKEMEEKKEGIDKESKELEEKITAKKKEVEEATD